MGQTEVDQLRAQFKAQREAAGSTGNPAVDALRAKFRTENAAAATPAPAGPPVVGEAPWLKSAPDPLDAIFSRLRSGETGSPEETLRSATALGVGEVGGGAVAGGQPVAPGVEPKSVEEAARMIKAGHPNAPDDAVLRAARNYMIEQAPLTGARQAEQEFRRDHWFRAGFNDLAMAALGGAGVDRNAVYNLSDAINSGRAPDIYRAYGRALVAPLPFVPNPEPKDVYTASAAQASAEGSEKAARESFLGSALPQAAASFAGMGASLGLTGGPLKRAGEAVAERMFAAEAPGFTRKMIGVLSRGSMDAAGERAIGTIPGVVNMAQYSAMPAIEDYRLLQEKPEEYWKNVGEGATTGAAIDLATRMTGGSIWKAADWLSRTKKIPINTARKLLLATPIAQSAAMSGITARDGDFLHDWALNSILFAGAGASQRLRGYLPGFMTRTPLGDRRNLDDVTNKLTPEEVAGAPEKAIPSQTNTDVWLDIERKIMDIRLGTSGGHEVVEPPPGTKFPNMANLGYPTPGSPEAAVKKKPRSRREVITDTVNAVLEADKKAKKPEPKEDLAEMAGPAPDTLEVRQPKRKPIEEPKPPEPPQTIETPTPDVIEPEIVEAPPKSGFRKLTEYVASLSRDQVAEIMPRQWQELYDRFNVPRDTATSQVLRKIVQAKREGRTIKNWVEVGEQIVHERRAAEAKPAELASEPLLPQEAPTIRGETAAPEAPRPRGFRALTEHLSSLKPSDAAGLNLEQTFKDYGVKYDADTREVAMRVVGQMVREKQSVKSQKQTSNKPIKLPTKQTGEKALAQHIASLWRSGKKLSDSEMAGLFSQYEVKYSSEGKDNPVESVTTKALTILGEETRERTGGKRAPIGKRTLQVSEFEGFGEEDVDLRRLKDDEPGPGVRRMFSGIPVDKENMTTATEVLRSNDRNWLSRIARFIRREAEISSAQAMLEDRVERASQLNRYQESGWRPQYGELVNSAKDVYKGLVESAGAERAGATISQVFGAKVLLLADAPWKRELIARYIYDAQARAMVGQSKDVPESLFLTQQERALVKKHWDELLPGLQEMRRIKDIIDDVAPPEEADIFGRRITDDPIVGYWRLARIGDFDKERLETLKRISKLDNRETLVLTGEVGEGGPGVGGGRPSTRHRRRRAGSALGATGKSEAYSLDLVDMIRDMATDRFRAVGHNRLRKALRNYAVDPEARTVIFNGKEERTGVIDLSPDPPWVTTPEQQIANADKLPHSDKKESIVVPETLKRVWERHLMPRPPRELPKFLKLYGGGLTHVMLLQGGEAIGHVAGLLGAIASMPELGKSPAMRLIAKTGIGRIIPAIAEVYDVKPGDKSFEKDFLSGIGHAALGRSFDEFSGERIPILSELKEWVFGPKGVEVRARIAMYRLLKRGDPKMSDAEAWYLVNDRLGTYVRELAPTVSNLLTGTFLDPFARPGVALGKGAVRSVLGFGAEATTRGMKKSWRAGTLLMSSAMTVGSWALLAKVLDNEEWVDENGVKHQGGRWPWQSGLRFGYVRLWGEEYPLLSLTSNAVWRGLSLLGMREASNTIGRGATSVSEVGGGVARGMWNATLGRLGPQWKTPIALLSGLARGGQSYTPFLTPGGMMEIGHRTEEDAPLQALKNALEISIPQYGDYVEQERLPGAAGESLLKKAGRATTSFFGFGSRPAYSDRERTIMRGRSKAATVSEVVSGVMFEVRGLTAQQQQEKGLEILKERLSGPALIDGIRKMHRLIKSEQRRNQINYLRGSK